ncbi:MAG: HU family DNA-binding protein [Pseudomonadales bacterium]
MHDPIWKTHSRARCTRRAQASSPSPGLLKVVAAQVPATKKRFGKNPFTGEDHWFAARPATVKVKVRPLKKLKDAL